MGGKVSKRAQLFWEEQRPLQILTEAALLRGSLLQLVATILKGPGFLMLFKIVSTTYKKFNSDKLISPVSDEPRGGEEFNQAVDRRSTNRINEQQE